MGAATTSSETLISRRYLIRYWATLLACLSAPRLAAALADEPRPKLTLAKQLSRSSVRALSPDGKKLCVEEWAERGYPLRVLEVGTWRPLYTGEFPSRALWAEFFADSRTMLVGGPGWRATANVDTGERTIKAVRFERNRGENVAPVGERTVLITHWESPPSGYRTETLALATVPDYQELARVPYATQARKARPTEAGIPLNTEGPLIQSDDRKLLVYSFDNILVCRRTQDLAVLWSKPAEEGLRAFKLAVAAEEGTVAAALADDAFAAQAHRYYVGIYNGKTGAELTRLDVNGNEWIALAPDGKLIAVVSQERGEEGSVVATASLYAVPSGRKVASVAHDSVKGRHQSLTAGCTVSFTSDGKYMITSGMTTRIWRIEE